MMKMIHTAVAAAAVFATTFAAAASADTLDDVVDRGTLRRRSGFSANRLSRCE